MNTQIRHGVFETNSSSSHSLSLSEKFDKNDTTLIDLDFDIDPTDTYIQVKYGEFGWEEEEFNDSKTKLSYVVTFLNDVVRVDGTTNEVYVDREVVSDIDYCKKGNPSLEKYLDPNIYPKLREMLDEVVFEYTGYKIQTIDNDASSYFKQGYIDHQSMSLLVFEDIFESKEKLANFIFNKKSTLHTGNDQGSWEDYE
jgi:hypothetical protein